MAQLLAGTLCSGFGLAQALLWLVISYELALAEATATLVLPVVTDRDQSIHPHYISIRALYIGPVCSCVISIYHPLPTIPTTIEGMSLRALVMCINNNYIILLKVMQH